MEVALIGVLATALFSVVGLLGGQMNGLRSDLQRQTERIGEHHAQTQRDFGEVRNAIEEVRRDVSVLRGEVSDLRGEVSDLRGEVSDLRGEVSDLRDEVRAHLAEHA